MPARLLYTLITGVTCSTLLMGCGCRDDNPRVHPNTPEEDPNDVGQWLSMDLMSDGSPAVSFYDNSKGGLGFAIGTLDSSGDISWKKEAVDGFPAENGLDPGDRGLYTSLAVDGQNQAWISYYDASNGALRYALRSSEGEWETGIAGTGSGPTSDVGWFSSLALNGSDEPVIAFYDVLDAQLRISYFNGSSFSAEVVDDGAAHTPEGLDPDVGRFARLMIHEGTEYIAYYDAAQGKLKLATGNSGSWNIEVVDDGTDEAGSGNVGAWPDLAMLGDELLIAYQDVDNGDLRLARGSTSSPWEISVVDSGTEMGADARIFIDGGAPGVYYFDGYNNDLRQAVVNTDSESDWDTTTLAGEEAALGFHIDTVTDGSSRYVACYDFTNRNIWFERAE